MIKSVSVTNHLGEAVILELRSPEKSGFLVQNINGLGPGKANINTTEVLTNDGAMYNSARVNSRNIVMSLVFLPNPTIEDTRQLSYKYFPIKKKIRLLIETDNRLCETYGYIESNEPNIFSREESTVISVVCPDSYFYSTGLTTTIFSGTESGFEFPFSNESVSESLITFGNINTRSEETVYYEGDAEIGIVIRIHFLGTATNIGIYNTQTREEMHIDTDKFEALIGSPITAGDDIIISTVKGEKFIYLLREGVYTNILNALNRDANWFQLAKGDNLFSYSADTGITNMQFSIVNQTVYEGI